MRKPYIPRTLGLLHFGTCRIPSKFWEISIIVPAAKNSSGTTAINNISSAFHQRLYTFTTIADNFSILVKPLGNWVGNLECA